MSDIIKSGVLLKLSESVFNSKWKYNYVELLRNSTFRWYEKKGDRIPKKSIILKNISQYVLFGQCCKRVSLKPNFKDSDVSLLISIPHDNYRQTRSTLFLCNNQTEMQEWVNSIGSTITSANRRRSSNDTHSSTSRGVSDYNRGTSNAPPSYYEPPPPYETFSPEQPPPIRSIANSVPTESCHPIQQTSSRPYFQNVYINSSSAYRSDIHKSSPVISSSYVASAPRASLPGNPPVRCVGQYGAPQIKTVAYVSEKKKRRLKLREAALGVSVGMTAAYAAHELFDPSPDCYVMNEYINDDRGGFDNCDDSTNYFDNFDYY